MTDSLESKIDEIYRLPLEEFTKARNALAKTLSGDAKGVASLAKPTLPMWAINQLYWKDPSTYKALIDAAEKLRASHRSVLSGRKADLRKPDQVHRAALERASVKTVSLFEKTAGRVSEPVRETIRRVLAALPSEEQAGRLTREPQPAGFSLLTGVTPRTMKPEAAPPKPERGQAQNKRDDEKRKRDEQREQQRAAEAREKAARAREKALAETRNELKHAQQAAERATFAVKKAESELDNARAAETNAASRLKEVERRLADLD